MCRFLEVAAVMFCSLLFATSAASCSSKQSNMGTCSEPSSTVDNPEESRSHMQVRYMPPQEVMLTHAKASAAALDQGVVKETSDETAAIPFSWAKKEKTADPELYKATVTGKCIKLRDCDNAPVPCNCKDAPARCKSGTKDNYKIERQYRGKVKPYTRRGEQIIKLTFSGRKGRRGCRACQRRSRGQTFRSCTDYVVGAGPYAITNKMLVNKGDSLSYTFKASGRCGRLCIRRGPLKGGDNYEMFAGLYTEEGDIVAYKFQRGIKQDWTTHKFTSPKTGKYYFKFLLAAYDRTNVGPVGAEMHIKNVQVKQLPTPRPVPRPVPRPTPQPTSRPAPQRTLAPTPPPTPPPTKPQYPLRSGVCVQVRWGEGIGVRFWLQTPSGRTSEKKTVLVGGQKCIRVVHKSLGADEFSTVYGMVKVIGSIQRGRRHGLRATTFSYGSHWNMRHIECKGRTSNWNCQES